MFFCSEETRYVNIFCLLLSFLKVSGYTIRMKKIYKSQKGFTLIELLIVIAIISVIASVLIPNVMAARDKGTTAAQRAEVKTVQTEAVVLWEANSGNLTTVCTNSTGAPRTALLSALKKGYPNGQIGILANSIASSSGNGAGVCHSTASAYGAEIPLKSGGFLCMDSTGLVVESLTTKIGTVNDTSCL